MEIPNTVQPVKKNTIWYLDHLREEVRQWPRDVRENMGGQLNKIEYGGEPDDFKPIPSIGPGVSEIRIADQGNQYRLIYVSKFQEAIYILHIITKKKTQKTAQSDINISKKRYKELVEWRKRNSYEH